MKRLTQRQKNKKVKNRSQSGAMSPTTVVIITIVLILILLIIPVIQIGFMVGIVKKYADAACNWKLALNLILTKEQEKSLQEICQILGGGDSGGGGANDCFEYGIGGGGSGGSEINRESLKNTLTADEGKRLNPYQDSAGIWTIGIGHNLQDGNAQNFKDATGKEQSSFVGNSNASITNEEMDKLFELDLQFLEPVAASAIGVDLYGNLPGEAKQIMVEMLFQMGAGGLADHQKMISALKIGDYKKAALEIADSARYDQLSCQSRLPRVSRSGMTSQEFQDAVAAKIDQVDPTKTTSCRVLRQTKRMWNLATNSSPTGNTTTGLVFPIPIDNYETSNSNLNFGDNRDGVKRCHAGVDLYFKESPGNVLAITGGTVINKYKFYDCGGKPVYALFIKHQINGKTFTVNYGELNTVPSFSIGSNVSAGQILGQAGQCKSEGKGMLHFELYSGEVKSNQQWKPPEGKTVGPERNYCEKYNYPKTNTNEFPHVDKILNPMDFLDEILKNGNVINDPYNVNCSEIANSLPTLKGTPGSYSQSGDAINLGVAFQKQKTKVWCGRTSQQMVLDYVLPSRNFCNSQESCQLSGANLSKIDYVCTNEKDNSKIIEAARKSILIYKKPVILYTNLSTSKIGKHIIVLRGYDPVSDVFQVNNPGKSNGDNVTSVVGKTTTGSLLERSIKKQACKAYIYKEAL